MQQNHGHRLGVLFVVSKAGFDEQFLANKAGGGMAAFADLPSRTQVPYWRGNGTRVVIETYLDELLGAIYLGANIRGGTRADMAFRAFHM